MPLQTASAVLADSVPVWIFSGVILAGGYMYDTSSKQAERLATLENDSSNYKEDVREIKSSIQRVEQFIIERHLDD